MMEYYSKTDSWTEAMRLLKEHLADCAPHNNVYFVYSEHEERYMITHHEDEISDWIHESWMDGACELSPEEEASSFHVYCYVHEDATNRHPSLYKGYKATLLNTENPIYRRRITVNPEHSVSFEIDVHNLGGIGI
ncbi:MULTISPECIES: hypothetical protein [unclassified Exiguobacterium]|uniref:hypothetical protein n=1 Tax=unclassified Exiguobacterium TaxID=2644629 RepID=UPI001BEC04CA|nr:MULTISPECIES: hypothetical protein [unclassified Exiguobacterium]